MHRYFFHIRSQGELIEDEDGLCMSGLGTARPLPPPPLPRLERSAGWCSRVSFDYPVWTTHTHRDLAPFVRRNAAVPPAGSEGHRNSPKSLSVGFASDHSSHGASERSAWARTLTWRMRMRGFAHSLCKQAWTLPRAMWPASCRSS